MRKKKRFDFSELEEVAQKATRDAFTKAKAEGKQWITQEQEDNLTLGMEHEGKDLEVSIFELYISAQRPSDALIVSRVKIDSYTKELIGDVDIYLPPIPASIVDSE